MKLQSVFMMGMTVLLVACHNTSNFVETEQEVVTELDFSPLENLSEHFNISLDWCVSCVDCDREILPQPKMFISKGESYGNLDICLKSDRKFDESNRVLEETARVIVFNPWETNYKSEMFESWKDFSVLGKNYKNPELIKIFELKTFNGLFKTLPEAVLFIAKDTMEEKKQKQQKIDTLLEKFKNR